MAHPATSRYNLKRNHPQLSELVAPPIRKCADCGQRMVAAFIMPSGDEICANCWSIRIARRERALAAS